MTGVREYSGMYKVGLILYYFKKQHLFIINQPPFLFVLRSQRTGKLASKCKTFVEYTRRALKKMGYVEDQVSTILSLLSAHTLISAHSCFFPSIIPEVAHNKLITPAPAIRPIYACRSANYAHKPLKTRPPGTTIWSVSRRLDIHGNWSRDFTVSSDLLHCFSTSQ